MPTAIALTPIRQRLSDCLGIFPAITKLLRVRWEDGEISTEEMDEVLTALLEMPARTTVCGGERPGSIEYALRNRHHQPPKECDHDS